MHIEFLVEDSSASKLVSILLPKIIGSHEKKHTWRIHEYKGVGRLPKGLTAKTDASKRILLDQLPRLLMGYAKTRGIDAVVVLVDTDNRDCRAFLGELRKLHKSLCSAPETLFRLAIEEVEAWYFGDKNALFAAYPNAKHAIVSKYKQDSVCGTWEMLAKAICSEDENKSLLENPWPLSGRKKHEWAEAMGPYMNIDDNKSPSFCKFRDGLRRLVQGQ